MSVKSSSPTGSLIAVFRTSLQTKQDVSKLEQGLTSIPRLSSWTVDLDDCNRVLRVVGVCIDINRVQALVQEAGFFCEELDD